MTFGQDSMQSSNATRNILKYKDGTEVRVPITEIEGVGGVKVTPQTDTSGDIIDKVTIEVEEQDLDLRGVVREVDIVNKTDVGTGKDYKEIGVDEMLKLRDNMMTFGAAPTGQDVTTLDSGTIFMHTVDVA